jgi:hypothetical protein
VGHPTSARRADDEARLVRAREAIGVALALTGSVADGQRPRCPACGTADKGKTKVFRDGGFKCHRCGYHAGNAVDFLVDRGWTFPDAVNDLTGGPARGATRAAAPPVEFVPPPEFRATEDWRLYTDLVAGFGDVDAAVAFYARWHISADAVREARAVRVDSQSFARFRAKHGDERLTAAGLLTEGDRPYPLVNDDYPFVEPHVMPDGRIAGLQFRASERTEAAVAAHKEWKRLAEAARAAGEPAPEKVDYVPKFLSVRGASVASRCGFGLPRIQALVDAGKTTRADGSKVRLFLVEGAKDLMAARTLGLEAFGMAGAKLLPVRAVCRLLRHFEVHVALDGDEAGAEGRRALLDHLGAHGVEAVPHPPPAGMDICDVLVQRVAAGKHPAAA